MTNYFFNYELKDLNVFDEVHSRAIKIFIKAQMVPSLTSELASLNRLLVVTGPSGL